ncbi:MAG: hypothetical protein AB8E82_14265 [Aureispira sp.]
MSGEDNFYYVPTSNSKDVFDQIASQFKSGVHSFNIIGSYGTGKSAFLVALSKHFNQEQNYFSPVNGQFNGCSKFEYIKLIGEATSFIDTFANYLNVDSNPDAIIKELKKQTKQLQKNKICLVIIVDEFGKFLEFAAKNNPDKELYFIQQLAEFSNNKKNDVLFVSTLHQNFDAYSFGLTNRERQEWEKVKGRLKELTFNEPVEQLLHLISEQLQGRLTLTKPLYSSSLIKSILKSRTFNLLNDVNKNFVKALYPFDLLSGMVLTKALQQYGQNERSLFHFLSTNEKYGLQDYDNKQNPYYNLSCVYDYLLHNYYSSITARHNHAYFQWTLLRNSIDRVEVELTKDIISAQKLIKTIGLLNILGVDSAKINDDLIEKYATTALGISNPQSILNLLLKKKIIRYQKFNEKYKLFRGTDIDIDQLIEDTKRTAEPIVNIVSELQSIFNLHTVQAKAITYKKGTPRFFKFIISDAPIEKFEEKDGAVDGFINLIFKKQAPLKILKTIHGEPILYGVYKGTSYIKSLLFDIKVIEEAIKKASGDNVAIEELEERRIHQVRALNIAINEQLFADQNSSIKWYFEGELITIKNRKSFNRQLSTICELTYPYTPVFRNELMNKEKVSTSIHTARRNFFRALLEHNSLMQLGFPVDKNPAEKTIYTTLLYNTGIHQDNGIYGYFNNKPVDETFAPLWETSKAFLKKAKNNKLSISEFINTLKSKPFKLKNGFVEFWVSVFLFVHREDYALFKDAYIPEFSSELFDLIYKDAHKYKIKTFDVQGVKLDLFNKYRELIQVDKAEKVSNSSFKKTATPFLVFYKQLPKYTKNTTRLSTATKSFREALAQAKELEKTFFVDLPTAFGFSASKLSQSEQKLQNFVNSIQQSIRELRMAFGELINRVEEGLLEVLGFDGLKFEEYSNKIRTRYQYIKTHLLLPEQKKFYTRINSQIPSREDWIKNVTHAIIGKKLEDISDSQEAKIQDKLKDAFQELDDLIAISKTPSNTEDDVIRVKLIGIHKQPISRNVIISAQQQQQVTKLEKSLDALLGDDPKINQAALLKLLQKYMDNE